jgi:hypothetical protein
MRYSFSGHESFPCKSMWLKKGYDYLVNDNMFTDPDAVVKLGVGKNMVQSIRFWLKAFGLSKDDEVTDIAKYLFDDKNGKDPYAEDNFTLWILHYLLVMTNFSSIYHLVFIDLQREKKEFDKKQLLSFIKRKCNVPEQKNVFNENTVNKDIRVFLQNYLSPTNPKTNEEYANLLLELGLLRENEGKYSFNELSMGQINPLIILFALVHIAGEDKTISFDKLQELSLVFCIPISSFLIIVRSLSEKYSKEINYTDNSGIRNVQFLKKINIFEVLNRYYNNDEI